MASVELRNIAKAYRKKTSESMSMVASPYFRKAPSDDTPVREFSAEGIYLTIPEGKTLVILGPSGCGKTTLLRLIAGFEKPDAGQVFFNGEDVTDLPTQGRGIGMVFQNYALYPHMNARKNVLSFFQFRRKTDELELLQSEKYKKTSELMGVDIEYLLDRNVSKLSGGEKQRVALARCITRDPSVFLLDEPFSNLDAKLRAKYRLELRKLLTHLKVTTVYVTHDQQEALILADLVAVIDAGKIAQIGTYEELYRNPASVFVAEFINPDSGTPAINIIEGGSVSAELSGFTLGVRPEDIELVAEPSQGSVPAVVTDTRAVPVRNMQVVTVSMGKDELTTEVPIEVEFKAESPVNLRFKKKYLFDAHTGLRVQ
jgi:ABC-type sugar transport system ATPase subunit